MRCGNFPPAAPYLMLIVGVIAAITAIYYARTRWRHRKTEPFEFIQPVLTSVVIGLALIGVAPLVLQTLRDGESQVLVGGLLLSAAIAVGASGGLIIAIARSVEPQL